MTTKDIETKIEWEEPRVDSTPIRQLHPTIKALRAEKFWVADTVESLETLKIWDEPLTVNRMVIKEIPNLHIYFTNNPSCKRTLIDAIKSLKTCTFTGVNHIAITPSTKILKSSMEDSVITGEKITIIDTDVKKSALTKEDKQVFIITRCHLNECVTGEEANLIISNSSLEKIVFVANNRIGHATLVDLKLNGSSIFNSKIISSSVDGITYQARIRSSRITDSTFILGRSHLTDMNISMSEMTLIDSHINSSSLTEIVTINTPLKLNGKVLVVNPGLKATPLIFHKDGNHRKVIINKKSHTFNDGRKQIQEMENGLLTIQYEPTFAMGENFFNLLDIIGNS